MKLCIVEDCGRKHVAKGMCQKHYLKQRRLVEGRVERKVQSACAGCGTSVTKVPSNRYRPTCSYRCRYFVTYQRWPEAGRELVGPLPKPPRETVVAPTLVAGTTTRFLACSCMWCGDNFTHDLRVTGATPNYCTRRCARRAGRSRYQLRHGRFDIHPATRLGIYERDHWTCQLCMAPVDRSLPPEDKWSATLDHIECQSWTLLPDHSAGNLRLAHRVCNSIRSDERHRRVA